MTAQRKRRGRKPATILRCLHVALRNAQTLLVDLGQPGPAAVELIRGRVLIRELRAELKELGIGAKPETCRNCLKPFVYWRDHWHCTTVSCEQFVCKRARAALKGAKT